jgi:hypothetical protein
MASLKEILLNTLLCIPKEVIITIIYEYAKCYGLPKLKNIVDIKENFSDYESYIICSYNEIFIAHTGCIYIYDKIDYKYMDSVVLKDDGNIKGMSLYDNELFVSINKCMYVLNVNNKKIIRQFKSTMKLLNFCVDENNIFVDGEESDCIILNKQDGSFVNKIISEHIKGTGVSNKYIYMCNTDSLVFFDKKTYLKINDSMRHEDFAVNCSDTVAFFDNEIYIILDGKLFIKNKYNMTEFITIEHHDKIGLMDIVGIASYNNLIFMINGSKLYVLERELL